MKRPSPQLERALRLGARAGESAELVRVFVNAIAARWAERGFWRASPPRGAGSGSTAFYVEIDGRACYVTIEPIDDEHAARVQWTAPPEESSSA